MNIYSCVQRAHDTKNIDGGASAPVGPSVATPLVVCMYVSVFVCVSCVCVRVCVCVCGRVCVSVSLCMYLPLCAACAVYFSSGCCIWNLAA